MTTTSQQTQARYQGFCNTKLLWKHSLLNLEQFALPPHFSSIFLRKLERRLRLGQLAEQFVFNQMETSESITILAENIQIQKNKQTLGELDALLTVDDKPVHLEIVYKFYVYDPTLGTSELERWIGPNRKDSLIEKLTKLKEKQLPLLYSEDCKSTLKQIELNTVNFVQRVLFKAQLFLPYQQNVTFEHLNEGCVCGFYINSTQLEEFRSCTFFIPSKLDWFLEPNNSVEWLEYSNFRNESDTFLNNKQSPLFWMKNEANELSKCFLVWW